jgi:hypothetical protein
VSGTGLDVEVTVPSGITWTVSEGTTATGEVLVQGRIVLPSAGTGLQDLRVRLASPHSFSNVGDLNLAFEEGSDGSSVDGGTGLRLQAGNARVVFRNLASSTLSVNAGTGGDVTVEDSELDLAMVNTTAGGRASLRGVELKPQVNNAFRANGGEIDCEEGILPAIQIISRPGGKIRLKGNRIRGQVWLEGQGDVVLERNQMSADPRKACLSHRADARGTLRRNVLVNHLQLGADGVPEIVLEENSFVGQTAVRWFGGQAPPTPFRIGPNYYGDPRGTDAGAGPACFESAIPGADGGRDLGGVHGLHRSVLRRGSGPADRGSRGASCTGPACPPRSARTGRRC